MITIKSSLSGQTLLTVDFLDGDVSVSPSDAREFIEFLARGPLRNVVNVSVGGRGQPIRAAALMGGVAARCPGAGFDSFPVADSSLGFLNAL